MTDAAINPHLGPYEPFPPTPRLDALNKAFRPSLVYAFAFVGVLFTLGLAVIMLARYASTGELDLQGIAAVLAVVLPIIMQHAQNRHTARLAGVS